MLPFMHKVKEVNQFLVDTINHFDHSPSALVFAQALPWVKDKPPATSHPFARIDLIANFYRDITLGSDPLEVGLAACTTALQRALAEALAAFGIPRDGWGTGGANDFIRKIIPPTPNPVPADLSDFSWGNCHAHPFLKNTLSKLEVMLFAMGCYDFEKDQISADVALRFPIYLRIILTHPSLAERFKPFSDLVNSNDPGTPQRLTLQQHAELMCRIFIDKPLFDQEAFALEQIYVQPECGFLTWEQIQPDEEANAEIKALDPFVEANGGRHDAETKLLELIADPDYRDAIVVQGSSGSGKTALSLGLCRRLLVRGLRPIVIDMRELDCDPNTALTDALTAAVHVQHEHFGDDQAHGIQKPAQLFEDPALWQEAATLDDQRVCRYVLILDGWDSYCNGEIASGTAAQMLQEIRNLVGPEVSLILTTCAIQDLADASFLQPNTAILSLRCLSPGSVLSLVDRVEKALESPRFKVDEAVEWSLDRVKLQPHLEAFQNLNQAQYQTVLGSPMLALMAMRVLDTSNEDPQALFSNPSLLYRELLSQTCNKQTAPLDSEQLQQILLVAAVAMSTAGTDHLHFDQLDRYLKQLEGPKDNCNDNGNKGSHMLSCLRANHLFTVRNSKQDIQFSFSFFYELIVAMAILQLLLNFGFENSSHRPDRSQPFWENGKPNDPRMLLADNLSHLLAVNWMTPRIHRNLYRLLEQNIEQSFTFYKSEQFWIVIRDSLTDIYTWWVKEIPMRGHNIGEPKSHKGAKSQSFLLNSLLLILRKEQKQFPLSQSQLDSHFGNPIWQMTAIVHYQLANHGGWDKLSPQERWQNMLPHALSEHQVTVKGWTLFAPGGLQCDFQWNGDKYNDTLAKLSARINAERPHMPMRFPAFAIMPGITCPKAWWQQAKAHRIVLNSANFNQARFDKAIFHKAKLNHAWLDQVSLKHAFLASAELNHASMIGANLEQANLNMAHLTEANLEQANLQHANLDMALMDHANLEEADLQFASLKFTNLSNANLTNANLENTDLRNATLKSTNIKGSQVSQAQLKSADCQDLKGSTIEPD